MSEDYKKRNDSQHEALSVIASCQLPCFRYLILKHYIIVFELPVTFEKLLASDCDTDSSRDQLCQGPSLDVNDAVGSMELTGGKMAGQPCIHRRNQAAASAHRPNRFQQTIVWTFVADVNICGRILLSTRQFAIGRRGIQLGINKQVG